MRLLRPQLFRIIRNDSHRLFAHLAGRVEADSIRG